MPPLSAVTCEKSTVQRVTSDPHYIKKDATRMIGCVSRSLQASSPFDETTLALPSTIGGQIDRLFETPIISTIIAAYSHLGKEGSKKSQSLHKVLIYNEEDAIRLRREELKTELATLESINFKQIKIYQHYLRMHEIKDIVNLCTNLKHLDLSYSNINDAQLKNLLPACSKLTSLILNCCHHLTDAIQDLVTPPLKILNLAGCSQLSNAGIIPFTKGKQLMHVNLSSCHQLTDTGLLAFSTCPFLKSLNLAGCKKLSHEGIKSLNACEELSLLNLEHCNHTTIGRQTLAALRPSLKVFI